MSEEYKVVKPVPTSTGCEVFLVLNGETLIDVMLDEESAEKYVEHLRSWAIGGSKNFRIEAHEVQSWPEPVSATVRSLFEAMRELMLAETEDRLHVAFARRDLARQIIDGVSKALEAELRAQDEAIQEHLINLGVPSLRLTDPPRTLYLDNRPYLSIVSTRENEDTDAKHERAAAALRAAGLDEFVGTRCNLSGLVSHYREILKEEGEEAAKERIKADLGEVVELGITTKARTRKAS